MWLVSVVRTLVVPVLIPFVSAPSRSLGFPGSAGFSADVVGCVVQAFASAPLPEHVLENRSFDLTCTILVHIDQSEFSAVLQRFAQRKTDRLCFEITFDRQMVSPSEQSIDRTQACEAPVSAYPRYPERHPEEPRGIMR